VVPANQSQSVEFRVDIAQQTDVERFGLSINSPQQDIIARNATSDTLVTIIDESGAEFATAILSGTAVLFDGNLAESFFNYPNPFGDPAAQTTSFNYHLEQDSKVVVRIYTLFGELVRTYSFEETDSEGLSGTHSGEIIWDGTNDKDQKVLNGVYVAVLTTVSGTATTKIAIAK
jgi:flagellar hook assembly protein FlgD